MAHTQAKKQSAETVLEKIDIGLIIKSLHISYVKHAFKKLKETIYNEIKEYMRTMSHQINNIH